MDTSFRFHVIVAKKHSDLYNEQVELNQKTVSQEHKTIFDRNNNIKIK